MSLRGALVTRQSLPCACPDSTSGALPRILFVIARSLSDAAISFCLPRACRGVIAIPPSRENQSLFACPSKPYAKNGSLRGALATRQSLILHSSIIYLFLLITQLLSITFLFLSFWFWAWFGIWILTFDINVMLKC